MNENLRAGYAESTFVQKYGEAQRKQAMASSQPSELDALNTRTLLAHGYGVTHALNAAAANEQTIQMGAEPAELDEALEEIRKYTAYVEEQIAKLNGGEA